MTRCNLPIDRRQDGDEPRASTTEMLTAVVTWASKWGRQLPREAMVDLFAALADLEVEVDARFVARPGVLAFTPTGLAHALDLVDEVGLKQAKRRLGLWRMRGEGPRYIKSGDGRSASIFYPIEAVLDWLASAREGDRRAADLRRPGQRPRHDDHSTTEARL